jgi:hypothetical protein
MKARLDRRIGASSRQKVHIRIGQPLDRIGAVGRVRAGRIESCHPYFSRAGLKACQIFQNIAFRKEGNFFRIARVEISMQCIEQDQPGILGTQLAP